MTNVKVRSMLQEYLHKLAFLGVPSEQALLFVHLDRFVGRHVEHGVLQHHRRCEARTTDNQEDEHARTKINMVQRYK
jgi:hypothetical protein